MMSMRRKAKRRKRRRTQRFCLTAGVAGAARWRCPRYGSGQGWDSCGPWIAVGTRGRSWRWTAFVGGCRRLADDLRKELCGLPSGPKEPLGAFLLCVGRLVLALKAHRSTVAASDLEKISLKATKISEVYDKIGGDWAHRKTVKLRLRSAKDELHRGDHLGVGRLGEF